jgi:hypothetical protein
MDAATRGGEIGQVNLRGVLPAGTSLRGYELKSILGQGAFGITYRARDLTLDRDVAIKEYLPTSLALREGRTTVLPRSPDHAEQFAWGRQRFMEEARTLGRLDRATAIVRVFDFLEDNGTAYMVMALIEGETLNKKLMREQKLHPEAVERIVFPLLDGLEAVHAIGFLHRDIKPANIMVDAHGRPTLIDFGASRQAMAERSTTLTAIFTPGYAAAEQFTSTKPGPWTDIYGLSATLYHAITGKIPPSAIERVLQDEYRPLADLMPAGFAPELLAGIDAGMAVRADNRPQSIAEWRHLLRPNSFDATRVARRPGPIARAARRSSKARLTLKGPALWGAAAAAFLVLLGGSYLSFVAERPGSVATLTAEQLEQALTERRKADALLAEKRRVEEEAQRKADADAEAKRQADAELAQAREARRKAEAELAQVKADIEARRQAQPAPRDQAEAAIRQTIDEDTERKAEEEAAARAKAEEEAQRKAAAEAEAKHQAEEELARAQAERERAEEEARAKAEAEAATRAAAEQARLKAEADTAKRKGDEEARLKAEADLAKRKAEEEARIKAEAIAKEKAETEAAQKKTAEAAEAGSRLEPRDRERLQVALTSLGFDTRGNDGLFGPRTRRMISDWQKARTLPTTGYLDPAQQQALLKEAATAVSKFDEERKKAEDEKRLAEEKARAIAALAPRVGSASTSADGQWRGSYTCRGGARLVNIILDLRLKDGTGVWRPAAAGPSNDQTEAIRVSVDGGNASVTWIRSNPSIITHGPVIGQLEGDAIRVTGPWGTGTCTLALTRVPETAEAARSTYLYDGTYTGPIGNLAGGTGWVKLQVVNGRGSGNIAHTGACTTSFTISISSTGDITGDVAPCTGHAPFAIKGHAEGRSLVLTGGVSGYNFGARTTLLLSQGQAAAASSGAGLPTNAFDGTYTGTLNFGTDARWLETVKLEVVNGRGSGTITRPMNCTTTFSIAISPTGTITGDMTSCSGGRPIAVTGFAEGRQLVLKGGTAGTTRFGDGTVLTKGVAAAAPSRSPFDGTYAGNHDIGGISGSVARLHAKVELTDGRGTLVLDTPGCNSSLFPVAVSPTGEVNGTGNFNCVLGGAGNLAGALTISGQFEGELILLRGVSQRGGVFRVRMTRQSGR